MIDDKEMVLDVFIPKQSQCLFSLLSSSRPHELQGAFCLLVLLKKKKEYGVLEAWTGSLATS